MSRCFAEVFGSGGRWNTPKNLKDVFQSGTFWKPRLLVLSHLKSFVIQMGGVLQYKSEVSCGVSLSSSLRSQEGTLIQMGGCVQIGGVLPYFLDKSQVAGVPRDPSVLKIVRCPNL